MPHHTEKRVLPYSAAQIYALVADIEHYPEFLPWCLSCAVIGKDGEKLKAEMTVGNKAFRESFVSFVSFDPPRSIKVEYGGGALQELRNEWIFEPLSDGSCEVSFFVDFKLKSRLLGAMMELFFDAAFRKMVAAFEARAKELYGK